MYKVALIGNPNVGKSTIFNSLTKLKQHTGNWPGKTVSNVSGKYNFKDEEYQIYDLPGTYSLLTDSLEEEIARDFICFEKIDAIVVVCDAVCLERNLNLVLQILEITDKEVICVNLMDEARKKGIKIDIGKLEQLLGVPIVGTVARSGFGIKELMEKISQVCVKKNNKSFNTEYPTILKEVIKKIMPLLENKKTGLNIEWIALRLLENNNSLIKAFNKYLGYDLLEDKILLAAIKQAKYYLHINGLHQDEISDVVVCTIFSRSEAICQEVIEFAKNDHTKKDKIIDKIVTNKRTGIPIMVILLISVLWITIVGSSFPSNILFDLLFWFEGKLLMFLKILSFPDWITNPLVFGVYRLLSWVVAVMLPPMAIFFPLFTLLEDCGYLPRIAFNLDNIFRKCSTCGKQALTMCMSFGCNVVGIAGTRIINSPRERMVAILTNNFIPCNGRFPTIIAIIAMFFIGFESNTYNSVVSTLLLFLVIMLGILMVFITSKILSKTILKGIPSLFALELPPYRRPQVIKVIARSIINRTLVVLGRAIAIAAPAGLFIWILANIDINGLSLLKHWTSFLDPFAQLFGSDGVILMAFVLGFPANEIVIPIMVMAYMMDGKIVEFESLNSLKALLVNNGWTTMTAVSVLIFTLMHFPCSSTCLSIKKETGSLKWTMVAIFLPTLCGLLFCFIITQVVNILGIS